MTDSFTATTKTITTCSTNLTLSTCAATRQSSIWSAQKRIRDASRENDKKAIVYAAGNYIGQRELTQMGIIFCQLPDALHER